MLLDHSDAAARAEVIELYRAQYEHDLRNDGPMAAATEALVERIHKGERLVLMCWCWPKRCHGNLIVAEINRRLGFCNDARASSESGDRRRSWRRSAMIGEARPGAPHVG